MDEPTVAHMAEMAEAQPPQAAEMAKMAAAQPQAAKMAEMADAQAHPHPATASGCGTARKAVKRSVGVAVGRWGAPYRADKEPLTCSRTQMHVSSAGGQGDWHGSPDLRADRLGISARNFARLPISVKEEYRGDDRAVGIQRTPSQNVHNTCNANLVILQLPKNPKTRQSQVDAPPQMEAPPQEAQPNLPMSLQPPRLQLATPQPTLPPQPTPSKVAASRPAPAPALPTQPSRVDARVARETYSPQSSLGCSQPDSPSSMGQAYYSPTTEEPQREVSEPEAAKESPCRRIARR